MLVLIYVIINNLDSQLHRVLTVKCHYRFRNQTKHKWKYQTQFQKWFWVKYTRLYLFYIMDTFPVMTNRSVQMTYLSHFWDRPVPTFSDVRFSYLALVQDKKITCVLPANACCTVYVNCPPQFSMLFLFKINNSLYISFQSFINTQILTISHIIT